MTQVDFYFNADDLYHVAQRLISKALKAKVGATVVVTGDAEQLKAFDGFLWRFEATSFIPHVFASDALAAKTAVVLCIGGDELPLNHHGLLINIGTTIPEHFSRFARVLELVSTHEANKVAGRERFKFYKHRGYPMSSNDLLRR
jgi:DNA polymerase III subunit chi